MKSWEIVKIDSKQSPFKIAVVAHFFYLDQAKVVVKFLKNIPFEFEMYVSTSPEKEASVRTLLAYSFPTKKLILKMVPNRGYDIAPFVFDFKDCYAGYDLVLKLHAKKSSHVPWLKGWGDYLLGNIVGSPETVLAILKMFDDDEELGLVYPEIVPSLKEKLKKDPWQENWGICRELSSRLGLSVAPQMPLVFPAGSMFWFRPKALESLFDLGLVPQDFPAGKRIRRNGTLAHAVERLLVLIAAKEGFGSRAVRFDPFKTFRDRSVWGKIRDRLYCEVSRLLDCMGMDR